MVVGVLRWWGARGGSETARGLVARKTGGSGTRPYEITDADYGGAATF